MTRPTPSVPRAAADATAAPAAPQVSPDDALRAGKPPVGTGSSPLVAQLIALAFVVLGVVAVQHLLVWLDVVTATSWIREAVTRADGVTGRSVVVLVVGMLAVVLGLLLLPIVVKPRPRRGVPLTAHTGVHLRRSDLNRVARAAVTDTDAVTAVAFSGGRRRLRVVATTLAAPDRDQAIAEGLRERLTGALAALERPPRLQVVIRHEGA